MIVVVCFSIGGGDDYDDMDDEPGMDDDMEQQEVSFESL